MRGRRLTPALVPPVFRGWTGTQAGGIELLILHQDVGRRLDELGLAPLDEEIGPLAAGIPRQPRKGKDVPVLV